MSRQKKFKDAINSTKILRLPRGSIATFGVTNIKYHIITNIEDSQKTKLREGIVISERPKVIVAQDLKNIFEGFDDESREYADMIFQEVGSDFRILEYRFRNELKSVKTEPVSSRELFDKINEEIDSQENRLAAIIQAGEDTWQVSLMKFIVEMTKKSFYSNITELEEKGFFDNETKVKSRLREEIGKMFCEARQDKSRIKELGEKLKKYGLFEEYQDRFFSLLK